jgi:hypothetical protein
MNIQINEPHGIDIHDNGFLLLSTNSYIVFYNWIVDYKKQAIDFPYYINVNH